VDSTYLTVAIPYVNADPHLGYAYELVLADIHARACRLDGRATRFLGGTDDYSLKNALAAEAAGVATDAFVAEHSARFAALAGPLDLSFDDFIRTSSDERHVPAVHRLWRCVAERGDLYRKEYVGRYCVGCEQFYEPDELVDGRCPEHRQPLEEVAEENWFFRLSSYQEGIEDALTSGALEVTPAPFRNEVLSFVRSGLQDISVSRSVERARGWGVPVPGDPSQVIYVWFDALANYVSALDYGRDGDLFTRWWLASRERTHVVGKGIVRFHAVYWPAFLSAAGLPWPTRVRVHPYLTIDGRKISKSTGVGGPHAAPEVLAAAYGADRLRWWFAREVADAADTDFTIARLAARANEDLAGGIGNLVNRIVTLAHRQLGGVVPADGAPLPDVLGLPERVRGDLRAFDTRRATQRIVDAVGLLNQDLERTQPWKLAGKATDRADVGRLLAGHVASARLIAAALEPITPALAARAAAQLTADPRLPEPDPILRRLDLP
jgi:methionyl-tRNA synthetase